MPVLRAVPGARDLSVQRLALCSPPHGLACVGRVTFNCLNLDSLMNVVRPPERLFNRIQLWSAGADIHAGGPVFWRRCAARAVFARFSTAETPGPVAYRGIRISEAL
jgi:hypothetical protein